MQDLPKFVKQNGERKHFSTFSSKFYTISVKFKTSTEDCVSSKTTDFLHQNVSVAAEKDEEAFPKIRVNILSQHSQKSVIMASKLTSPTLIIFDLFSAFPVVL